MSKFDWTFVYLLAYERIFDSTYFQVFTPTSIWNMEEFQYSFIAT